MEELSPAQWIELLIEKSDKMRDSGFLELSIGCMRVTLTPRPPEYKAEPFVSEELTSSEEDEMDALMSPETFNLQPGSDLPGYYATRRHARDPDFDIGDDQ